MSDTNKRELYSLTLAGTEVQFHIAERVVKPAKKLVDEAKAKGLAKDHADYPQDKQVRYLVPDLSNATNISAFFTGLFSAAEAAKPGSGEDILNDFVKHRCADASEETLTFSEGSTEPELDDVKFLTNLTTDSGGKITTTQLRAQWQALSIECITLGDLAMKIQDWDAAAQAPELAAVDCKDYAQLLLILNNKSKDWREKRALLDARDAEAAKKAAAKAKK